MPSKPTRKELVDARERAWQKYDKLARDRNALNIEVLKLFRTWDKLNDALSKFDAKKARKP